MYRFATPLALVLLATTAAVAQDPVMIKEIEVEVDLDAVVNPEAAARYGTLATDLEGAISARLVDRIDEDGMNLTVDISEAELSNSFTEALGIADTKLVGDVKIAGDTSNALDNVYTLTVSIEQVRLFFPEGTDETSLSVSSDEYYASLIAAFADAVAVRVDD
ncbi:MAG: hypothetical protein B7Z10_07270 [Rhodobacterales bacterium 32-66-7]|nr:MAG: hypothetical protein B7Z31_04545 [Rhodobacterales bacterium 12-65-15]OYX25116.1 MAG: hypothetical protein B7Z10_07270 [Rhodobacterales bacterium 32-66-7]